MKEKRRDGVKEKWREVRFGKVKRCRDGEERW